MWVIWLIGTGKMTGTGKRKRQVIWTGKTWLTGTGWPESRQQQVSMTSATLAARRAPRIVSTWFL
jgi:hypothetical protein